MEIIPGNSSKLTTRSDFRRLQLHCSRLLSTKRSGNTWPGRRKPRSFQPSKQNLRSRASVHRARPVTGNRLFSTRNDRKLTALESCSCSGQKFTQRFNNTVEGRFFNSLKDYIRHLTSMRVNREWCWARFRMAVERLVCSVHIINAI